MSSIVAKPFSWTNKIVRAVFKGSPNLITTEDLNRQIEALKKEMYVLQQANGVVISDFTAELKDDTLTTKGTYVFCRGVRFDLSLDSEYRPFEGSEATSEKTLCLYAKKELITYDTDFSKEISGAKFADGTTQPAANHYVYSDVEVQLMDSNSADKDFVFPNNSAGYEYICSLAKVVCTVQPEEGYYPNTRYLQVYTVPMGKSIMDASEKYATFRQYETANKDNTYKKLVPNADDDWKTVAYKLWSRLCTLEKRLFIETFEQREGFYDDKLLINNKEISVNRRKTETFTFSDGKTLEFDYSFYVIGNICFAQGDMTIRTISDEDEGQSLSFKFTVPHAESSDLPTPCLEQLGNNQIMLFARKRSVAYGGTVSAHMGMNYFDVNVGISAGEAAANRILTIEWRVIYPILSKNFWSYSIDEHEGLFNDNK